MSKINDLAREVAERFREEQVDDDGREAAFSPEWVMVFAEIIMQLVAAFQECQADAGGAATISNRPRLVHRIALRQKVQSNLGVVGFIRHGRQVIQSILDTGAGLTESDMIALYNEV